MGRPNPYLTANKQTIRGIRINFKAIHGFSCKLTDRYIAGWLIGMFPDNTLVKDISLKERFMFIETLMRLQLTYAHKDAMIPWTENLRKKVKR